MDFHLEEDYFIMFWDIVDSNRRLFIYRRLLVTFLGGLELFAYKKIPYYVYILQVSLYSVIPALNILLIVLEECEIITFNQGIYVCALTEFAYAFLVQIVAFIIHKKKQKVIQEFDDDVSNASSLLGDIVNFDSPLGPGTWSFLIREKGMKNIFLHSLVAGFVGAGAFNYIRPMSLHSSVPYGLAVFFCVIGIVTTSVGLWPLIGGAPPEPAIFYPLSHDASALSRPAHMLLCIFIHWLAGYYPDMMWLLIVDIFFQVIFATSSVLWLLGLLPPIDSLVLCLLEQWQVVVLGGSPTASNLRLISQTIFGTLILCIAAALPSFECLMVVTSCFGFLLSTDYAWMMSPILPHSLKLLTIFGKCEDRQSGTKEIPQQKISCKRELVLCALLMPTVIGLTLACQIPHVGWYQRAMNVSESVPGNSSEVISGNYSEIISESNSTDDYDDQKNVLEIPLLFQVQVQDAVGSIIVFLAVLILSINEVQKVYFLGVIRNPYYVQVKKMDKIDLLYKWSQLLQIGGPILCLLYVHQIVSVEPHKQFWFPLHTFAHFLQTIPLFRILRHIWQFPQPSILQLSLFYFTELFTRGGADGTFKFWRNLSPAIRLFCIGLFYLWGTRFCQKLCSVFAYQVTSIRNWDLSAMCGCRFLIINIVFLPIVMCALLVASITTSPLLPLYTLPIFLLSFPRPLKFWPYPVGHSSNTCEDSVFYEKVAPQVKWQLQKWIQKGCLGIVEPGEHFLLAFDDRLIWIEVLECGLTYLYFSVKGLELNETACHNTEGLRVQNIFDEAFVLNHKNQKKNKCASYYNTFGIYPLTPLSQFTIKGYTSTESDWTVPLNLPETLNVIEDYFLKALLFVLMEDMTNTEMTSPDTLESPSVEASISGHSQTENKDVLLNLLEIGQKEQLGLDLYADVREIRGESEALPVTLIPENFLNQDDGQMHSSTNTRMEYDALSCKSLGISQIFNEDAIIEKYNEDLSARNVYKVSNEIFVPKCTQNQHNESFSSSDSMDMEQKSDTSAVKKLMQRKYHIPVCNNPSWASLSPSPCWFLGLPLDQEAIDEVKDVFPLSWFKHILAHFGRVGLKLGNHQSTASGIFVETSEICGDQNEEIQKLQDDSDLEESYRIIAATCLWTLARTSHGMVKPPSLYDIFNENVPPTEELRWLINKKKLYYLALKAYRIGVKLSLDDTLIGSINDFRELHSSLEDYCQSWFFGRHEPPSNKTPTFSHPRSKEPLTRIKAIHNNIPNLLTLRSHRYFGGSVSRNKCTSFLTTTTEIKVSVGRLSGEIVRGLWATLVLESLYMASQDEERYSFQAHTGVLRNLTAQAAEPPLGYPIYSSPPQRFSITSLKS